MGLIDITERVDIPADIAGSDGQWVEVRLLSLNDLDEINGAVYARPFACPSDADESEKARIRGAQDMVRTAGETCKRAIVKWSDASEPTPDNIAKLPTKVATFVSSHIWGNGGEPEAAEGEVAVPPTSENSTAPSTDAASSPAAG